MDNHYKLYTDVSLFHYPLSRNRQYFLSTVAVIIFAARKRSLGQGNFFRSVCQEFCPQRGESTWAGTPSRTRQVHPQDQAGTLWTRYTPRDQVQTPLGPGRYTPPWDQAGILPWDQAGTPLDQLHPPRQGRYTPQTR